MLRSPLIHAILLPGFMIFGCTTSPDSSRQQATAPGQPPRPALQEAPQENATARKAEAQTTKIKPFLTDTLVQKYLNSYRPAYAMMSAHWGARKYTPKRRMLPPRGSFERAVEEMRHAGTLPDFELLLQSHGFNSIEAWKATSDRIGFAYMTLRREERDPAGLILHRQARNKQLAQLTEHRQKLVAKGDARSRSQLKHLEMIRQQTERGLVADADAEVLRPYFAQFNLLNEEIIQLER